MKGKKSSGRNERRSLHPRNKNIDRYDFEALTKEFPELQQFFFTNPRGHVTINFARPDAVRALNSALLRKDYGVTYWDIPPDYLCPPIPGRADYLHYLADLLTDEIRSENVSVLDIGVGANCIYPLLGYLEFGWRFVGSDVDPVAISSAEKIVSMNNIPKEKIAIRLQSDPLHFFRGIIRKGEHFTFSMCNPPFHASLEAAHAGTRRKWKNLGKEKSAVPVLNFGGQFNELVYPGGESAFVTHMIQESVHFGDSIRWFTTLVSKQSSLTNYYRELHNVQAQNIRTIEMTQGQKKSRFIAWTFQKDSTT